MMEPELFNETILNRFFETAFNLMNDYTTDKRGDIGSMVREASMYGISNTLKLLAKSPVNLSKLSGMSVQKSLTLILQQLAEKIDRTRLIAGSILQDLVDNAFNNLPDFSNKNIIKEIFQRENIKKRFQGEQERLQTDYSLAEEMKSKLFSTISTQDSTNLKSMESSEGFIYYWNLPHCVFPLIVPLLELKEYSFFIVNEHSNLNDSSLKDSL